MYSVLPELGTGNISLQYTIDQNPTNDMTIFNQRFTSVPMFKLIQVDDLDATNHSVQVNVTSAETGTSLGIDFVSFVASYDTIQDLYVTSTTISGPGGKRSHVGAIIGGVIGGLVFAGLLMILMVMFKRRRAHRARVAAVIGRSFNPQLGELYSGCQRGRTQALDLDVKVVPNPRTESYPMTTR